jgi:LacI family transcriptional regulator
MKSRPCAGLDLQPHVLGARAAELLVAQLQRNERGVPEWPTTTMIPARWVDGPSLLTERRAPAAIPVTAQAAPPGRRRKSVAPVPASA